MKNSVQEDLLSYLARGFTLEQAQVLVIELNRQRTIKDMHATLKKCNVPPEQYVGTEMDTI